MPGRRRSLLAAFVGAVLAGGGVAWFLLIDDPLPARSELLIDWERVRALAGPDGSGPSVLRSEVVARGHFLGFMICAGCGSERVDMEFRTEQLVYADGSSVVIDAVHDAERHAAMPMMDAHLEGAFARQTEALRRASRIVLTHEHFDHANGLRAVIGEEAVRARMLIPDAQRLSPQIGDAGLPEEGLARIAPLPDERYRRIAPGVVAIALPGHTPGSQAYYVRRADGAEYLYLGDVVWSERNLRERVGKSRLMSLVAGEAREPLAHQIAYFSDLFRERRADPDLRSAPTRADGAPLALRFVVSHDPVARAALVAGGWIVEGLDLETIAEPGRETGAAHDRWPGAGDVPVTAELRPSRRPPSA